MTLASPFMAALRSLGMRRLYELRRQAGVTRMAMVCAWERADGSGGRDEGGQRHRGFVLLDRLRKAGTRLGFAAAAAVRAAGARLQLRERAHAVGDFAADVVVGDGVAKADVHAAHKNANANDCQLCKWRGRFAVQAARQPCRGSSGVGSPSS